MNRKILHGVHVRRVGGIPARARARAHTHRVRMEIAPTNIVTAAVGYRRKRKEEGDRKTESQKDGEPENQSARETDRQRNRETSR